jgi:PepSY-associated TM region
MRKSGGASVVWADQYRGDILHIRNPRTMSAGDRFLRWQFPLHNGEAFGPPGRLVILLSGLSLPLLYVTGLSITGSKNGLRGGRTFVLEIGVSNLRVRWVLQRPRAENERKSPELILHSPPLFYPI